MRLSVERLLNPHLDITGITEQEHGVAISPLEPTPSYSSTFSGRLGRHRGSRLGVSRHHHFTCFKDDPMYAQWRSRAMTYLVALKKKQLKALEEEMTKLNADLDKDVVTIGEQQKEDAALGDQIEGEKDLEKSAEASEQQAENLEKMSEEFGDVKVVKQDIAILQREIKAMEGEVAAAEKAQQDAATKLEEFDPKKEVSACVDGSGNVIDSRDACGQIPESERDCTWNEYQDHSCRPTVENEPGLTYEEYRMTQDLALKRRLTRKASKPRAIFEYEMREKQGAKKGENGATAGV